MQWLDYSRIFAVFAVVVLHVSAFNFKASGVIGDTVWWTSNVFDSLARWCVPVLIMVSGALLLDPKKKESVANFYKKRASRILIPLLFWTIIFIFLKVSVSILSNRNVEISTIVNSIIIGNPYHHMWFLYMIFGMYLFVPFFRLLVSNAPKKSIFLFICLLFSFSMSRCVYNYIYLGTLQPQLFISIFVDYTPYLFLGYFITVSTNKYRTFTLLAIILATAVATMLGYYYFTKAESAYIGRYFYSYLGITVVPMSISIFLLMKRFRFRFLSEKLTRELSLMTLGIYIVHPLFIRLISYLNFLDNMRGSLLYIPIVSLVIFIISLIVTYFIRSIPILRRIV